MPCSSLLKSCNLGSLWNIREWTHMTGTIHRLHQPFIHVIISRLTPLPFMSGRLRRFETWNAKETEFLNETQLITAKPVVYLINLSEKNYAAKKGKWLKPVYEWVQVCAPPPLSRIRALLK